MNEIIVLALAKISRDMLQLSIPLHLQKPQFINHWLQLFGKRFISCFEIFKDKASFFDWIELVRISAPKLIIVFDY